MPDFKTREDLAMRDIMRRYQELNAPDAVVSRSFNTVRVTLTANMPTLILRADRPKAYLLRTIATDSVVSIGPSNAVSATSGFPIIAIDPPFAIGVGENTEIWGFSTVDAVMFVLDMGL